jgi:hypothetical protein
MTQFYDVTSRNNTPLVIGPYQFLDQNGTPINLSSYNQVFLELKLLGSVMLTTLPASIVTAATGIVTLPGTWTPVGVGTWTAQFYFTDFTTPTPKRYYGEPVDFQVAANVDDLQLKQLPAA